MKIKLISILLVALMGFVSHVNADEPSNPAPKEVINNAKTQCENYAKEDQVADEDKSKYVLSCVNDELESQGYDKVDSVE
ncbi:MAG: hypothetical protein COW84_00750 [Gammaproteobacteria bacterium CG22_combo_CG10-13_8_21_14_all_40_8]|nr:MAG: hypothetical protein COW84_00750 [Gammaproteobacteria bacterium CG22_combo_CG10-13_8_21_14_all_40_8]